MKHRILCIFFSIIILSSCSYNNPKNTLPTPIPQPNRAIAVSLPKLIVSPDTGFYLNCTHITQIFSLSNKGALPLTWITTLFPENGEATIAGVTVRPAYGTLPAGGRLTVTMQGKTNTSFVLRFIYKESDKHFVGISQGVNCEK